MTRVKMAPPPPPPPPPVMDDGFFTNGLLDEQPQNEGVSNFLEIQWTLVEEHD